KRSRVASRRDPELGSDQLGGFRAGAENDLRQGNRSGIARRSAERIFPSRECVGAGGHCSSGKGPRVEENGGVQAFVDAFERRHRVPHGDSEQIDRGLAAPKWQRAVSRATWAVTGRGWRAT